LISPNDSVDLSIKDDSKWSDQDHLKFRVNAVRGLVTLLNGETESGFFNVMNIVVRSNYKICLTFALYQLPSCSMIGVETFLEAKTKQV
jgi:hypothetical protein